jgi:hypothetical protein
MAALTAIHDEGDGLTCCECHSQGYDHAHSRQVSFSFAGIDGMVTFKVWLWSFLCKLSDMFSQVFSLHAL